MLDLGCGTGRDAYALAQLVGSSGEVVGVDMTAEQLAIAREHQGFHATAFGYDNLRFLDGYIERLEELELEPESFDVVVSNCVVTMAALWDDHYNPNGSCRACRPAAGAHNDDAT